MHTGYSNGSHRVSIFIKFFVFLLKYFTHTHQYKYKNAHRMCVFGCSVVLNFYMVVAWWCEVRFDKKDLSFFIFCYFNEQNFYGRGFTKRVFGGWSFCVSVENNVRMHFCLIVGTLFLLLCFYFMCANFGM